MSMGLFGIREAIPIVRQTRNSYQSFFTLPEIAVAEGRNFLKISV
jgi:hypothetical protein